MQQNPHILYICHDGVIPPLGQSQVLNLLLELARGGGLRLSLLSFEKEEDIARAAREATRAKLEAAGIDWTMLHYHRHPTGIATVFDVLHGTWRALQLVRRHGTSIVHGRSYVSSSIALLVKLERGLPYLFDMRGFWADEKVDVGTISKTSLPYHAAKLAERFLLRQADVIASLSAAGVREMKRWPSLLGVSPRFEVVSTYTNLRLFSLSSQAPAEPFTVGYVGGAQGWYMIDPFFRAFALLLKKKPEARLLILNRYDQELLRSKLAEFSIPAEKCELKAVEHDDVAKEMARMHCAIFFIRASYSKIASAPTKMGELLASGIPCLTNSGVGDVEEILLESGAGCTVRDPEGDALEQGVSQLLALASSSGIRERCAAASEKYFSLARGAENYRRIYAEMLARRAKRP